MKHYYLIHFQYLGFRFHGWQKQPGVKTVEVMLDKTLKSVLDHGEFKLLGTSRTDAMVSAAHTVAELFLDHSMEDLDGFLKEMNQNLPGDIRVLKVEKTSRAFNIINSPRIKEYGYYFAFGQKYHPFCAPLVACFQGDLDIDLMKRGALMFHGKHHFGSYCTKPGPKTCLKREIFLSRIEENRSLTASFFPENTWVWHVHAMGFLRNQIRLMMGQLVCLGRGDISLDDIDKCLKKKDLTPLRQIAPPSGLVLNQVRFL